MPDTIVSSTVRRARTHVWCDRNTSPCSECMREGYLFDQPGQDKAVPLPQSAREQSQHFERIAVRTEEQLVKELSHVAGVPTIGLKAAIEAMRAARAERNAQVVVVNGKRMKVQIMNRRRITIPAKSVPNFTTSKEPVKGG